MTPSSAPETDRHPIFAAIESSVRREILHLLLLKGTPVTERHFTIHLTATEPNPTREGEPADRRSISTSLVHTHLPVLEEAGLITWDRDTSMVETTSHLAYDDPRFHLLLEAEADDLDTALSNLSTDHRRVLLTFLWDAETSITRTDLARELLRSDETAFEPGPDTVTDALVPLYHVHLPALADAGLVEYDRETGRATYTGHPAVEEVFAILYRFEDPLVDSYDGFFQGLKTALPDLKRGTGTGAEWPHAWRNPSHE
ncbi:winged helix-turn-helix domain-containing protein [Halobacteria archaeon HArc-gm2]|nr:winged helix-turn-helix domain-containing protein [Halobacteria archaeon HArc-gm2]